MQLIMKTTIILSLLLFASIGQAKDKYTITRYEQKSDALFICINHTKKPVYVEHFFTTEERKDTASIVHTIEGLVAELYIKADEYRDPEKFTAKPERARRFENKTDSLRIAERKILLLAKRDSLKNN